MIKTIALAVANILYQISLGASMMVFAIIGIGSVLGIMAAIGHLSMPGLLYTGANVQLTITNYIIVGFITFIIACAVYVFAIENNNDIRG